MATTIAMPGVVPGGVLRSPDHQRAKKSSTKPTGELNVSNVVLGKLLIKTWYPSFYPEEIVGRRTERLYVCQYCFKYSKELIPWLAHTKVCPGKTESPPGDLIYFKNEYAIHEVDGEEHRASKKLPRVLYTQNLSLFAKLFLETKSVFFDVATFLYYLLIYTDPLTQEPQVVGFFSKEKLSWENNNLACIIIFPPWQKRGLGQILMGVSYELSKREGRVGGPEKPLSELGLKGYMQYWSALLSRYLASCPAKKSITVRSISEDTYMQSEDITLTLKEMGILDSSRKPGDGMVLNKAKVRAWMETNKVSSKAPVDPDAFVMTEENEDEDEEDQTE
ncbi:MAG: hypothetical protein M1820_004674 [Bogoriella megaspora]|nr:MAG: hypothetical protein M1820_004674 [Bogoriella megaspora]